MEERSACKMCGASILLQTAERYEGNCRPCHKKGTYKRLGECSFGLAYEISFNQPHFNTDEFFDLWKYLELSLAGPLFQIRCEGNCDYVFRKGEGRFPGVYDVASFQQWCLGIIEEVRRKVSKTRVETKEEKQDELTLLRKAEEMAETVRLAHDLLMEREAQLRVSR